LADQLPQIAVRLPLILEVSADLNSIGLSQIMAPDSTTSMLTAPGRREGAYWLLSYRIEEMESPRPVPRISPHDVRTMAIETVLTSQVMDRFRMLLNEVMDIELGNQPVNPNRYSCAQ
jgi:hypothetical protein